MNAVTPIRRSLTPRYPTQDEYTSHAMYRSRLLPDPERPRGWMIPYGQAPTESERAAMLARVAHLRGMMIPTIDANADVIRTMRGFHNTYGESVEEADFAAQAFASVVLADVPTWAVFAAMQRILKGGPKGWDRVRPPTPAQFYPYVEDAMRPFIAEQDDLEMILGAREDHKPGRSEKERAEVMEALKAFQDDVAKADLAGGHLGAVAGRIIEMATGVKGTATSTPHQSSA